jgi:hypothetical protein
MVTAAQHKALLELQREKQIANQAQQEYFKNLTSGKVSIAEALLNPRTEQKYYNSGQSVDVSGTSINLPQFIAEAGYDVTQPQVIPNSLFSPQSINVTGSAAREIAKEREIQLSAGISSDVNLNSATSMNEWISSNPQRQINMALPNPQPTNFGNKSSIPKDNDTQTVLLGGNNQLQETDVNTNMQNTPPLLYQNESTVNWAQNVSIGSALIPLAVIGGLYFLGKKK